MKVVYVYWRGFCHDDKAAIVPLRVEHERKRGIQVYVAAAHRGGNLFDHINVTRELNAAQRAEAAAAYEKANGK